MPPKKPKLISNEFEKELNNLIDSRISNMIEKLSKEELNKIKNEILPDIDLLISKKIKEHFSYIISIISSKLGEQDNA